jgi:hypothetical protein
MIRFAGRKMYTIFAFSLFVLPLIASALKSDCVMDNVQVDLPILAENFNVRKLVPEISISAVNCNSLNMGTVTRHTRVRKFYGIVSLRSDIIFLSDIRMCNKNGTTDMHFIKNTFAVNPYCSYNFYYQSQKNSRGVSILIKKSIVYTILDTWGDVDDNYLVLKIRIHEYTVILVSIYGPNIRDDDFFNRLTVCIRSAGDFPVIMGGDWNTVYSCSPLAGNIDVLNMSALPNPSNSKKIKEMCECLKLTDPYM